MRFGLKESLVEQIISVIAKFNNVEKAVIFGSRARNDYKYNSDIDIAVFVNGSESVRSRLLYELNEMDVLYKFDVVEVEKLSNEKLIANILEQGIDIYRKK